MKYNPATSTSSEGFSRNDSAKVLVNQHTGHMNDGRLVNKGRGPTGGGTSVPNRGKEMFTSHAQVRNPGGTRAWDPKAGQNYKGNPNSINVGRGPTKGNE